MSFAEFVRLIEDGHNWLYQGVLTMLRLPTIDFSPEGFYRYPGPIKRVWRFLTGWEVVPVATARKKSRPDVTYQWVHPNWHESNPQ